MKSILLLAPLLAVINASAQLKTADACGLRQYCAPCVAKQCRANVDARRCDVLLNTPFGAITKNADTACEGARASQNVLYQLQTSDCERSNQRELFQCTEKSASCVRAADTCHAIKTARARPAREFTVLWVDDHPDNNKLEQRALEQMGAKLTFARSTDQAMANFMAKTFDLVISDFARAGDKSAGYTLLHRLRLQTGSHATPYIIYSANTSDEMVAEAKKRTALDQTNDPVRLLKGVEQVLAR